VADEAVLRIKIEEGGAGGQTASPGPPAIPPPAGPPGPPRQPGSPVPSGGPAGGDNPPDYDLLGYQAQLSARAQKFAQAQEEADLKRIHVFLRGQRLAQEMEKVQEEAAKAQREALEDYRRSFEDAMAKATEEADAEALRRTQMLLRASRIAEQMDRQREEADRRRLEAASQLNTILRAAEAMRGTLGGVLGLIAGAGLDILAAFRKIREKAEEAGTSIPQGTLGQGVLGAALFGLPGAGVAATRAGATGGDEAAVASATASATALLALRAFRDALIRGTEAVGGFAAKVVSPSADPAEFMQSIGSAVKGVSSALFYVSPLLGIFGSVVGTAIESVSGFMKALDGMVDRYGEYNPEIAMAQAQAEVRQIMGDLRRSKEAAPDLVKYVQQRSDMQQQFEDAKISMLSALMPIAKKLMEIGVSILPFIEVIVNVISEIAKVIPGMSEDIDAMRKKAEDDGMPDFKVDTDMTKLVKQGYVPPGQERGIRTPKTPDEL
jgi:hypothetical protein